MRERDRRFVEVAIAVITRYGVRRATMADIAREAGVSRQTLYSAFANKDEIVAASMRLIGESILARLEEAWREEGALRDRLDAFFRFAVVEMFDQLQAMPDAEDLVTGYSDAAREAATAATDEIRAALEAMLTAHDAAFRHRGTSAAAVADLVLSAGHALKYRAADRDHLLSLLDTMKTAVLELAGEGGALS